MASMESALLQVIQVSKDALKMTEKTPIPEAEIEQWKSKYLAKGLPEALLDELIADMNLEYEASIALEHPERLADLTVNITDANFDALHFYRICLNWGGYDIQSRGTDETTFKFIQVACVQIHIEVFKISNDGTTVTGYGYLLLNHSTDETAEITINTLDLPHVIAVSTGKLINESISVTTFINQGQVLNESCISSIEVS